MCVKPAKARAITTCDVLARSRSAIHARQELEVWRADYTRKGEASGVARNMNTSVVADRDLTLHAIGSHTCKQFSKAFLDGPSFTPLALVHKHYSRPVSGVVFESNARCTQDMQNEGIDTLP